MTLGTYGVLTLDAARKLARAHLAQIETVGADPLGHPRTGGPGRDRGRPVRGLPGAVRQAAQEDLGR